MSYLHRQAVTALLLAIGIVPVRVESARAAEDQNEAPTEEARNVAVVKVELKQENGKVFSHGGVVFDWGTEGDIIITQDDHTHDVSLRIDRPEETGKKIDLTVGYTRDGTAIMAAHRVSFQVKKREVIRIEGGLAIAITVVPKTMKVDAPQEPERDKIKAPKDGSGNPLDGI